MSNLKLPNLSYASLYALLSGGNNSQAIGYATRARLHGYSDGALVSITHHGSVIADLLPNSINITDAGYASSTTIARLHKVLADNGVWPAHYGIAIRQGVSTIITTDTLRKGLTSLSMFEDRTACFERTDTGWSLLDLDTP